MAPVDVPRPPVPRAVILASGDPVPAALLDDVAAALDVAELTVAADGGIEHAHRAGRDVGVLIGDLDSVGRQALARARTSGTEVLRHPADKDATDLELALTLVAGRLDGHAPPEVLVVGGHGGRTDHLLANLLLLAAPRWEDLRITAWLGTETAHVVRDRTTLRSEAGRVVTLLAAHGPAAGVTSTGLRFPLTDAVLEPGSTLGVSNELVADTATVAVRSGVLLTIQSAVRTIEP